MLFTGAVHSIVLSSNAGIPPNTGPAELPPCPCPCGCTRGCHTRLLLYKTGFELLLLPKCGPVAPACWPVANTGLVHHWHTSGFTAALPPALLGFVQVGRKLYRRRGRCILLICLLLLQALHHVLGNGCEDLQWAPSSTERRLCESLFNVMSQCM